ncbi:putative rrna-processing protein fcf1 protein [Eutypa lata UCREL1]|uniref:Putative rrna-processing protein fcf1 protein n=1 Tax=Eutypa lata (strain UCR-EL1) TaxID=1287681 RepID=M7TT72_EUTLA|nr:putative rrna-processing protein fcf1 protein [Eutypa lata UCREL1]
MGVAKKTRKFAEVKRVISRRDNRRQENAGKADAANAQKAKATPNNDIIRVVPQMPSNLFFQFNENLKPPYSVLVDTNFLSHTVQRKLPLLESMMDCLYAKCTPIITSCVMAELEKLGPKYRIALRIARDERWERLECDHKGTYADDCIIDRVMKHRTYLVSALLTILEIGLYANLKTYLSEGIYIVATNDKDLCRRVRKIPGVPILNVARGKYVIERLPGAPN